MFQYPAPITALATPEPMAVQAVPLHDATFCTATSLAVVKLPPATTAKFTIAVSRARHTLVSELNWSDWEAKATHGMMNQPVRALTIADQCSSDEAVAKV